MTGLTRSVLDILAASPLPVRTPDLVAALNPPGTAHQRRCRVWACLSRLHKDGIVRAAGGRLGRSGKNRPQAWALAVAPGTAALPAPAGNPGRVRCLGPLFPEHEFDSPDRRRCRVCPACRRKLDESLLGTRAEYAVSMP